MRKKVLESHAPEKLIDVSERLVSQHSKSWNESESIDELVDFKLIDLCECAHVCGCVWVGGWVAGWMYCRRNLQTESADVKSWWAPYDVDQAERMNQKRLCALDRLVQVTERMNLTEGSAVCGFGWRKRKRIWRCTSRHNYRQHWNHRQAAAAVGLYTQCGCVCGWFARWFESLFVSWLADWLVVWIVGWSRIVCAVVTAKSNVCDFWLRQP